MNTSLGYAKKTLTDSNVLLSGGGDKALSEFIGSLNWDSTNKKLQYKSASSTNFTDLITFGSNAFTSYSGYNIAFLNNAGTTVDTFKALTSPSKTLKAGTNVQMTAASNVITITATDTTYSTVSKSEAGLCPILPNETTTTKYLRLDGSWTVPAYPTKASWNYDDVYTKKTQAIPVIVGPSTDTTAGTWTGTTDAFSVYADGLTIIYVPAVAGASTTTLNINGLGAKTCHFTNTDKLTTHFAVGTPIMFTYYGGYWKRADYDSNSNTQYYLTLNGVVKGHSGKTNLGTIWAPSALAGTGGYILATNSGKTDLEWVAKPVSNVTSALYVGASNGTGNSALSTNGNVYLIFAEGSSYSRYKIVGSGRASVTSDASGNITINSSGYSNFGAATASTAGSAGLVPAPGVNILGTGGYFLRADGSWVVPTNTWKAANSSQEGYVPKSTANKILRANGNGALYWGDDANTTYTFYNLLFQNSGGTTVDTYKPTTSPTKTLKAGDNVTISAASNVITIASTNTWNAMTGATSSANGTTGYVNATPPKDGYNTKFLRADGTWSVPNYPTKASWNYDDVYLKLSGGTMTGNITMGTNSIVFNQSTTYNWNVAANTGITLLNTVGASATGAPGTYNIGLSVSGYYGFQLAAYGGGGGLLFRNTTKNNFTSEWVTVIDSSTIGSQSVNYATSAGGVAWGNVSGKPFNWSGQSGQPTWLWGSNDGSNYYVWNPSNFSVNYANSAGNSDTVDGFHAAGLAKFYLSPMSGGAPADSAKSWFTGTMPSSSGAIIYNVPGSEKTIIAGKSSGSCGHMLQLNYDDTYLRILRYAAGSWKSTDWEKISAGYADSAGSVAWSNVTSKPDSATRWPSWSEVTSKPSSFTPSSHSHSYGDISGGRAYLKENIAHYFRDPNSASWRGGLFWGSGGNESMSFVVVNSNTRFLFVIGSDIASWGSSTWLSASCAMYITSSGAYATNFYTTSDRSKKQNIFSFSEHIRKFQMKDTKTWHYGVIALEVPEMFRDGEEGNMTVNYNSVLSYYVGLLENKVKELEEKIKVLETKLNKLI